MINNFMSGFFIGIEMYWSCSSNHWYRAVNPGNGPGLEELVAIVRLTSSLSTRHHYTKQYAIREIKDIDQSLTSHFVRGPCRAYRKGKQVLDQLQRRQNAAAESNR
jgi:hypothetical protein